MALAAEISTSRALAQVPLVDIQLTGTANELQNGGEFTLRAGSTFTGETGSIVDLFHATVALPDSLSLKDLTLTGTNNKVADTAVVTFLNGSSLVAAAGSNVDISAANITFPSVVVLTTGSQTLSGKTLVSPIISCITADSGTSLTLSGGSGGPTLTLGTGPGGTAQFSSIVQAGGFVGVATGTNAQLTTSQVTFDDPRRIWQVNLVDQTDGVGGFGYVRGPFIEAVYNSPFSGNGKTFWDAQYTLGYNISDGGGNIVPTEPAFGFCIEQDYWDGTYHQLESYFRWRPGSGTFPQLEKRPLFWQINRETGSINSYQMRSNGIVFTSWDSPTEDQFALLSSTGFSLLGISTQTADTQLTIQAQNGYAGVFSMTGGFQVRRVAPNFWSFDISGTNEQFAVRSNDIGFGGTGNFFGGVVNIEPRTSRKDFEANLALRLAADQSTSFALFKNSSDNFLGLIDSAMNIRVNSAASFLWGNSPTSVSIDTGLSRNAAGVVEVNNGTPGSFAQMKASQFVSAVATGTPPLVVDSTTNVPNLNASSLNGATFASPGAIGASSASTAAFTTVTATSLAGTSSNDLTLSGGNSGASLVLGASAGGNFQASTTGGGKFVLQSQLAGTTAFSNKVLRLASHGDGADVSLHFSDDFSHNGFMGMTAGNLNFGADSATVMMRLTATRGNLLIGGTTDITGSSGLKIFGTTASTSPTTGAFQVVGGVGIGGAMNVAGEGVFGGKIRIAQDYGATNELGFYDSANAVSYATVGVASTAGGLSANAQAADFVVRSEASLRLTAGGATDRLVINSSDGAIGISSTKTATSPTSAALAVAGGLGVNGDAYLGGTLNLPGNSTLTGSSGGLSLATTGTDQDITLIPSGTGSVSATGPLKAMGRIDALATMASTSTTTGALVVAGGVGIAGDQYLGGTLNLPGGGAVAGAAGNITLTAGGTDKNIVLTPSGNGTIVLAGPVSYSSSQTFSAPIALAGGASVAGASGSLALSAAGTNQNITLAPSGTGIVSTPAAVVAGGALRTTATTASSSTSTGALVVAGGAGIAGDQYLGGSLNLTGGGALSGSTGNLALTAGGTDQSIALTPSGAGIVSTPAAFAAGGIIQTTASAASTSPSTGALIVAGGAGIGGDQYLGGSLNLNGGASIAGASGALTLNAAGTNQNITLTPSGTGSVSTAAPLSVGGRLSATATTASTSTTTGALVVAGGVGVAGDQYLGGALNLSGGGAVSGASGNVSLTAGGTDKDVILTPSGTGRIVLAGPVSYSGAQTFSGAVGFSGGGAVTGSSGSLALAAGGTNQNITLTPSGTGVVSTPAVITSAGGVRSTATTASTSTSTGALIVSGGFGLAGDQYLGGSLNLTGGGTLSGTTGNLALAAGGTNQSITLAPSGSGQVAVSGSLNVAGLASVTSTTDSTSTATGALVVSGGAAVQKRLSVGDDLMLTPTAATTATVRLSGTAVTDMPGIWFKDGGSPSAANVALAGNATTTIINTPNSNGTVSVRLGNSPVLTAGPTGVTQNVPLNVTATSASISVTTGSATFGGGIGVNGRASVKTLSVGGGSAVDLIQTTVTTLDFPSVAANGGVQDLTVSMTGAGLGDSVNIVETNGVFAPAGLQVRAIVTSANTITVRATNLTSAAIDPSATTYRITLISF